MNNLYGKNLAWVYDEIYQGFIDYKAEYDFYKTLCKTHNAISILEIACGSGNLSESFTNDFLNYTGLDYSEAMLEIAKTKFKKGNFIQGDMRKLNFTYQFSTILITGRSTSYLIEDIDIQNTFNSIHKALEPNGIFIFDCIDAAHFMPYILKNKNIIHYSNVNNKTFERESVWERYDSTKSHLVSWKSKYYDTNKNDKILIGEDSAIFRTFTNQEIQTNLLLSNFQLLHTIDRKTYAFNTKVYVCRKITKNIPIQGA
ncbi:Methyltransferase domain-containing protein [Maribacter aquivivus]|uniref:Methyltransferase domain-containing protein n=1 Tax=Maribacter aquivivus TaxID=228958 RepID=A0A1M6Q2M3_9FLAO|nr:class I SAM-dependent methyltransferase [Maribacter aquivivus]SHK14469.1 Methyltransferase domain-containing protein [Maribacter aquivivus]